MINPHVFELTTVGDHFKGQLYKGNKPPLTFFFGRSILR
jgi:hypothetical protein